MAVAFSQPMGAQSELMSTILPRPSLPVKDLA
jgi:hypothetical protein